MRWILVALVLLCVVWFGSVVLPNNDDVRSYYICCAAMTYYAVKRLKPLTSPYPAYIRGISNGMSMTLCVFALATVPLWPFDPRVFFISFGVGGIGISVKQLS